MATKKNFVVLNNKLEKEDFKAFANFMATKELCFIQHCDFRIQDCLFDSVVIDHFHEE